MENKNIYKKLMEVQTELKAPKAQRNTFGNYNYRSCEDIVEAVKPLLNKQGLILNLSDEMVQVGDRYYIRATARVIDIETGDKIETTALAREDETKKGMDLAQITGSVSSYARKYALNGMFAIDDTKDSDATNTHGKEDKSVSGSTRKLSEAQIKRLYALASKAGYSNDDVEAHIRIKFNKEDIATLTKTEYDTVCNGYIAKAS